jgi:AcrR family transcriptional regulator
MDKITGECLRLQSFFGVFYAQQNQKIAPRKPCTDAPRNRERILEVAKEVLTRSGANASLDDIAQEAAVGAGTLYRHFPTRDALIEAVYRTEVGKLAAAEKNRVAPNQVDAPRVLSRRKREFKSPRGRQMKTLRENYLLSVGQEGRW